MRLFYGSHCPTEQANLTLFTLSKDSNLSPVPLPPVRRKRQARLVGPHAEFTITTICPAEQRTYGSSITAGVRDAMAVNREVLEGIGEENIWVRRDSMRALTGGLWSARGNDGLLLGDDGTGPRGALAPIAFPRLATRRPVLARRRWRRLATR
jgi:hypothetical protein